MASRNVSTLNAGNLVCMHQEHILWHSSSTRSPPPILLCARPRRSTWRERSHLACLISCMLCLSPILTEFHRNMDFEYLITTLDLSWPNTGRCCLCSFVRIWFGYSKLCCNEVRVSKAHFSECPVKTARLLLVRQILKALKQNFMFCWPCIPV